MNDIRRFWLQDRDWPDDFGRWVFLGRAVQKVGAHLFREQWNVAVPTVSYGSDERFNDVQKRIAAAAATGRLVTGIRPQDGGATKPMPAEWWNTEKLRPWFTMCQMNPARPFGDGISGKAYRWIFVEAEGLTRLISPAAVDDAVVSDPAAPAAGIDQGGRQKRKAGRRNAYAWDKIKPIVEHCCNSMKQMGGYDSRPGAHETTLIKAIQTATEQKGLGKPSRQRLQEKLLEWNL